MVLKDGKSLINFVADSNVTITFIAQLIIENNGHNLKLRGIY